MIGKRGLVSVTFRQKTPDEIIALCAENGLESVEWGADVHVRPGEPAAARAVGEATRAAGLSVVSYGSYHYVGRDDARAAEAVLASAEALGAANVRVWAGPCGSDKADDTLRERVAAETRVLADECAARGMTLSFEYHGNTLTDTPASAVRLLTAISHPNCYTYWQPVASLTRAQNIEALTAVLPWLTNVHVFQWRMAAGGIDRRPLAEGAEDWAAYLEPLRGERVHNLQLEFVADDAEDALARDAAALLGW